MTAPQPLPSRLIGALFVERGLVSESQIRIALEIQNETGQQLGQILVERFGVSRKELASVVAEQWAKLGGSSGPEDAASWRRLGDIFVDRGFVSEDELNEALARQREAQAEFLALAEADPSNVAARNDVAIGLSKIAEMLDAEGRTAEAVRELQTATAIHLKLAAADPSNSGWKLALASDYNRLATVQAKRGDRAAAIENHTKAVEMTRELRDANPENVELSVAVALARLGRGDAYAAFGRRARGVPRETDLATAEHDYLAGTAVLEGLLQKKAIEGTDVKTLEAAREELARIRADRAGAR